LDAGSRVPVTLRSDVLRPCHSEPPQGIARRSRSRNARGISFPDNPLTGERVCASRGDVSLWLNMTDIGDAGSHFQIRRSAFAGESIAGDDAVSRGALDITGRLVGIADRHRRRQTITPGNPEKLSQLIFDQPLPMLERG
jgi:hypothetical protein